MVIPHFQYLPEVEFEPRGLTSVWGGCLQAPYSGVLDCTSKSSSCRSPELLPPNTPCLVKRASTYGEQFSNFTCLLHRQIMLKNGQPGTGNRR
jgi:hypothetical protein